MVSLTPEETQVDPASDNDQPSDQPTDTAPRRRRLDLLRRKPTPSRSAIPVAPPNRIDPDPGGDRDRDAATSAAPAIAPRGERAVIALTPTAALPDTGSALSRSAIPPPLVLVDRPSLGSDPRRPPSVHRATPDSVLDGADLPGNWTVRAASVRGDDHRYFGETRQDAMGYWLIEHQAGNGVTPVLLACVADGLGSKPLSHLGSALACDCLREELTANLARLLDADGNALLEPCDAVVRRVSQRMRDFAAGQNLASLDLSTTLMAAVIHPVPGGTRAILFRVGDSTALVHDDGSWRHCYGDGFTEEGMYSTATDALPDSMGTAEVTVEQLGAGALLMLCTDGMSNPMRDPTVRDQLGSWWGSGQVPALTEFYWQFSFRVKTYGDDRTAICVWLR